MSLPVLNNIIDLIVPLVKPDKIILFGSYARGDFTEHSDIDLLILKKGLKNEREISTKIYNTLYTKNDHININVDVISLDYDKFLRLKDNIGYIFKTINEEGVVVYEWLPRMAKIR